MFKFVKDLGVVFLHQTPMVNMLCRFQYLRTIWMHGISLSETHGKSYTTSRVTIGQLAEHLSF